MRQRKVRKEEPFRGMSTKIDRQLKLTSLVAVLAGSLLHGGEGTCVRGAGRKIAVRAGAGYLARRPYSLIFFCSIWRLRPKTLAVWAALPWCWFNTSAIYSRSKVSRACLIALA